MRASSFRRISLIILVLAFVLTCSMVFIACSKNANADFTITFEVDGKDYYLINTQGDETIKMPDDPTKDGFVFDGWYCDNNTWQRPFTANSILNEPLTSNMSVYAKWTAIEYTATFKADGNTIGTASYTMDDSKIKNAPSVPNKDGYDGVWENYTIKTGGIIVNAVYTAKQYTISYSNTKGVTNNNKTNYTPDTATFTLSNLSKEGYTFDGWYNGSTKVTTIEKGSYGNLSLEAKWTAIEYTATFKADGSTIGTATYTVEDSKIKNAPSVPNKDGYDGAWENYTIKTGGITVNAVYTAKQYTITWKDYDGTILKTTKCVHGQTPTFGNSPSRASDYQYEYKFTGWSPVLTAALEDATYTANYSQNKCSYYTIKYDMNGGNGTIGSQSKKCGSAITLSNTIPTYEGHKFVGWNNIYENTIYYSGDNFSSDINVTLYAMWEHNCDHCEGSGTEKIRCSNGCVWTNGTYLTGPKCSYCGATSGFVVINGYGTLCGKCYNNGRINGGSYSVCSKCNGTGEVNSICSVCNGSCIDKVDAPTTSSISGRKIVLNSVEGYEYSIDGINFQSGSTFDNLHPNTEYTFYQRKAGNGVIPFGCISSKLVTLTSDDSIYYIDYELDGGINDSNNPSQISYSSSFTLKSATKEHYDFVEWKCNGTIITTLSRSTIKTDVTLVAIWSPHKYDVSFDLNGGSFNEKRKATVNYVVDGNTSSSTYEIGTKVSYFVPSVYSVFLGWYTDPYYHNLYNFDTPLYNNMTLYARLYNLDSSEKLSSDKYHYNETSKGYTWGGSGPSETFYFAVSSSCTVTFGGSYNSGSYNLYNISNHSLIGSGTLSYGTSKSFSIQATATNPTILRVYFSTSGDNQQFHTTGLPTKNTATVYDSYDINNPISLDNPVKNGYTFLGWTGSNGDDPSTNVSTPSIPTGEVNYTANWSLNTYAISYELNGGVNDPSNPTTYTVENPSFYLKNPSKENYDFKGWTFNNSSISYINTQNAQNYVLTATWSPHTYSISYNYNGGTGNNPSSYNVESNDIVLTKPTKNGYTFIGWTGSNGNVLESNITIEHGSSGDRTYTANWSLDSYSITYVLYGGTNATKNPSSYTIVDTITLKDASKDYYIFDGWYKESQFINKVETLNGQYGNMTLYAKYTPFVYNVSYDISNACSINSINIMPAKLSVTDYESLLTYQRGLFGLSDSGKDYGYSGVFYLSNNIFNTFHMYSAMPKNSSISPASWLKIVDIDSNQVVFNKNAGSLSFDTYLTLTYGHSYRVIARNMPSNWYMESNNCDSPNFFINNSVSYNSPIAFPIPGRHGFDFMGWYDENDNPIATIWNYISDQTFYAKWEVHSYSVIYYLDGGTNNPSNPSSFVFTDYIELLEPQKDGYTFDGWYSDSNFKNKVTHVDGSKYSDVELYAKWIPNTYTATLDYGGGQNCPTVNFYSQGNIVKTIDLFKDTSLSYFIPSAPSENLVFGGWYTDSSCTHLFSFDGTVNANTNLYAKWINISGDQHSQLGADVDVVINGNNYDYITICSLITQTITITSTSGLDVYGTIYDSNWNPISSCDDISDDNLDFSITITLEAGEIYYIGYKANQVSTSGVCVISITGTNCPETYITGEYTEIIETINVTYDSSFKLPSPKKEGYEFEGWFDADGNKINESCWNYVENITIYAHWKLK